MAIAIALSSQSIIAGAMTGTSVITGTPLDIRGQRLVSFQAVWTGTPTGAFGFEISNHPQAVLGDGSVNPAATWTPLTLPASFSSGNPAGAAGSWVFEFVDLSELWIRPKYTNSASTGTLNVLGTAKP